jgi:uncharacterized protein YqhQ
MAEEKIRLGGMALANGVLVHGPRSWACAIRLPGGELRVASDFKRFRAAEIEQPLLRGPARLLDALAILPALRRRLPEARLPFERPSVLASMLASAATVRLVRGSNRVRPASQELLSALLSLAPAAIALRGSDAAAYHGAEHVSIGTYEHGERREKEHERCGSHLVGPLLATTAIGNALAARAPAHLRSAARFGAQVGALALSTEIFAWMVRNPEHRVAKALARPGHELQHRLGTQEPTPEQLEVADAALAACLALEEDGARNPHT